MPIPYRLPAAALALLLAGPVHAGAVVPDAEPPKPVVLENLSFDHGSGPLSLEAKADLSRLAKVMRDPVSAGQVYRVEGHSEARPGPSCRTIRQAGPTAASRSLSQAPAEPLQSHFSISPGDLR